MTKKISFFLSYALLLFAVFLICSLSANAAQATFHDNVLSSDQVNISHLTDDNYTTYVTAAEETTIALTCPHKLQGIYIVFEQIPTPWTLTDNASGENAPCGMNGFLHEYVDTTAVFGTTNSAYTLTFPAGTVIGDIYAFSEGTLPSWVQCWEPPVEEADLLLISSHADDEQLFFGGLLPLYAGEMEYDVQVAYMVQYLHADGWVDTRRSHEQLNGLWAVGITHYPVMSDFPDLYSESLEGARSVYSSAGVTEEMFTSYITDTLNRFRPLVVVTHDPKGEYGHGTHILTTHILQQILREAENGSGTWLPEKVYLHLYEENPITLDLDVPLSRFDGKTAFEMAQYGFSFHKSQHWTWFNDWIYGKEGASITKATQVWGYSPCRYGLYFTTVGYDTTGGDMFENVKSYAVRNTAWAEEESSRAETEPVETTSVETVYVEPQESTTPETWAGTNQSGNTSDGTKTADLLPLIFVGILCVGVGATLVIYAITLRNLNNRRKRR